MNVENITSSQPTPETRIQSGEKEVIDLRQIKSILYLGVKGKVTEQPGEPHRVDTFA